jgi:hypothetical protein
MSCVCDCGGRDCDLERNWEAIDVAELEELYNRRIVRDMMLGYEPNKPVIRGLNIQNVDIDGGVKLGTCSWCENRIQPLSPYSIK